VADSWRPKWQNIGRRNWEEVRDSWLGHTPEFPAIAARPDPGLEHLSPLLEIPLNGAHSRHPDVPGLRKNNVWEAVFLFHKCSHTSLASQRLAQQGMHSWCLFNAYHSAYLGAKGIMSLLGVAFPNLRGRQVALDLCPEPLKKQKVQLLGRSRFEEFIMIPLQMLDQRRVWEGFQRVLRLAEAECWDESLRHQIIGLNYEQITPPRNHFLYKVPYWPLEDLAVDASLGDLKPLLTKELDVADKGFLLNLSFSVYRLFEQLMSDLAFYSEAIREQFEASRCLDVELPELDSYRVFCNADATT
jgi:hypothetical protein